MGESEKVLSPIYLSQTFVCVIWVYFIKTNSLLRLCV